MNVYICVSSRVVCHWRVTLCRLQSCDQREFPRAACYWMNCLLTRLQPFMWPSIDVVSGSFVRTVVTGVIVDLVLVVYTMTIRVVYWMDQWYDAVTVIHSLSFIIIILGSWEFDSSLPPKGKEYKNMNILFLLIAVLGWLFLTVSL